MQDFYHRPYGSSELWGEGAGIRAQLGVGMGRRFVAAHAVWVSLGERDAPGFTVCRLRFC